MTQEPAVQSPVEGLRVERGLAPRQCGRCRQLFEGDPADDAVAMPQWWVCGACRAVLMPNRPQEAEVLSYVARSVSHREH